MKINRYISLITSISLLALTGCGNKKEEYSYWDSTSQTSVSIPISSVANVDESSEEASLFSSDKCVISSETNDNDDNVSAQAALIFNHTKRESLFCKNPYERIYPASTTKVLTAYIALKRCNLDDYVTISAEAARITEIGAKLCEFKEGDKVTVRDLLYATLVYSANDAATALGCYISGTEAEFAKLMNEECKKLGATDTNFTNANGLHNDNHYTTVYDMYIIFSECIKDETFKTIINTTSYSFTYTDAQGNSVDKTIDSTNQYLLGNQKAPDGITVIGGKTGTTNSAGCCLLLYSEDITGDSYISIIMKASDLDSLYYQMTYLLNKISM